ncbi:hypothetical protein TKK_0012759 [Trichogramma kaykai]
MGPFPRSKNGYSYIVVFGDLFTRYIEIKALRKANAASILKSFEELIVFKWGCPKYFLTDNGTEYSNKATTSRMQELGIVQTFIAKYHAQSNPIERVNRSIKTMTAIFVEKDHSLWDQHLQEFAFAINTSINVSTGYSPAYLNFGKNPRTIVTIRNNLENPSILYDSFTEETWANRVERLPIIHDIVRKNLTIANQDQARYYNKKRKDVKFNINDLVTIKKHTLSSKVDNVASKLAQKYKDPGRITKIISPVIYEIENEESKKLEIVHVSDIKPFNIDSELESENDSDDECTEAEKNETVSAPEPKVNNIAKDVNKDIETVARPSSQSETTTPPSTEASEAEAQAVDKENYAEHDNAVQADDIKTPADHTDITVRERSITYVKDDKEDIAQTISKNEAKSHDELVEKLRDFVDKYEPLRKPIREIKGEPWYLDVETVVGTKKQKEDSGKVEIETKTRCEKAVKVAKTIDDEMCWNCRRDGHQYTICDRPRTRLFCFRCGAQNVTVKTCKNDRCIEIARKKAAKNKKQ